MVRWFDSMAVLTAWGGDDSAAASAVVMVTNIVAAAGAVGAMATTGLKMENQTQE